MSEQRDFQSIANQWLEVLLKENEAASGAEIALVLRLGALGQRLIFEANAVGMADGIKLYKEAEANTQ